jgi:hypothetical protein
MQSLLSYCQGETLDLRGAIEFEFVFVHTNRTNVDLPLNFCESLKERRLGTI